MLSGPLTRSVTSEEDIVELTDGGWYKTPRIIKGLDFLAHIQDTLACGNLMYVKFSANDDPVRVSFFRKLYDTGEDNSYLFTISDRPRGDILIKDLTQFEFIQYRPQTVWVAIRMGSTKRFSVSDFDKLYIDQTFREMTPVAFIHNNQSWTVMGLELASEETGWFIYLKRWDSDFMTRLNFNRDQKFIYNPISGSWSLDDPTQEIKDLEEIKQTLRADTILDVTVSGVPMKLIRVQEIAKGVLFFVFQDEKKNKRYYYNRPAMKLRIVTDSETGEQKYLLDHIKAMYID